MNDTRLYRGNVFLGLAFREAFVDPTQPKVAELNNTNLVKDITCATWEDGTEFTLGDSETDTGLTFCSNAGDTTLTTKNATVTYQVLRDRDRSANGVFNLAFDLLAFADVPYFALMRLGKPNIATFAIGDIIRLVQVKTDNPTDIIAADASVFLKQQFAQDDLVNWNYKVTA